MIDMNTKKALIQAGLTGGILAIATRIVYGGGTVSILNMDLPQEAVMFAAGAVGSGAASLVKDQVLARLPKANQAYVGIENAAVGAVLSGGAAAIALKVAADLPAANLLPVAGIGAASHAASEYLTENVLSDPRTHRLIF